jgi:hypothetical protein
MRAVIDNQLDANINLEAEGTGNRNEHLSLKSPQKSQHLMMIEQEKA